MLWDKENKMEFWYPKIPETVLKPKTEIIMINPEWAEDGSHMTLQEEEFKKIEEASNKFRFPLFMRGSETSGKHSWEDTCFVKSKEEIRIKVSALIEDAMLKDIGCDSIILREFIEMDTGFYAFHGKMPVNPERRYFIRDGKVVCHHAYWVKDSIVKPITKSGEIESNWEETLEEMNDESQGEIELLTSIAEKIAKEFEGYWSIDFCRSKEGKWYCIDMALGEDSFHPECKNKLTKDIEGS